MTRLLPYPIGRLIQPWDNVFFGLLPDLLAGRQAEACADDLQRRRGRPDHRVWRRCLHVTLANLSLDGIVTEERLARATDAAEEVRVPPFLLEFNRIESWRGDPRPLVMTGEDGVIGADGLHAALGLALAKADLASGWASNFTAHMTLLRDRLETPIQHVLPIRWWVREFVLIHSHVGQGRYTILGRWPLIG
ncbi:MAG TPA: 2'-5' RNA ligase family protein [Phenylobacterium sp.]|jgi:2'-5' RNA ligase|uniref:2'-5' RNA ligase family protein n=1 Tax=Phenylobacterium sp. TaxID=1871053 RepID=UPI002D755D8E|nr:2'-5' RNA ligase family protein [Phenylobacterium sp.]HZZ69249.1 2'-5' RNA ligase family protein [Phenylobacterium sp.]